MTDFFREVGELGLGSRLKALSDRLYEVADSVYRTRGSPFEARWFPVMRLLRDRGPLSVTEIAREIGMSHASVSQIADRLVKKGWLKPRTDPEDARRRLLVPTQKANEELRKLAPVWRALRETLAERPGAVELMSALEQFTEGVEAKPLDQEIAARTASLERAAVRVVPFEPRLREHFYRINAEWLQRYFYLEEFDHRVLSNPEGELIAPGGAVLFAMIGEEVVGTCALRVDAPHRYEVTKMAVVPARRGLGIGRKLIEVAIQEFHRLGGSELFLESNKKQKPALRLYESAGFVHTPRPSPSHYQRADVYMTYAPQGSSRKGTQALRR